MFPSTTVTQGAVSYVTSLSLDVSITAIIVISLTLISLRYGKEILVAGLLAVFSAIPLLLFFPLYDRIPLNITPLFGKFDAVVTIVLLFFSIILYTLFYRIVDVIFSDSAFRSILSAVLLSFAIAGTLFAGLHLQGAVVIADPATFIDLFFSVQGYAFSWLLGVLGLLYLVTR